MKRLLLIILTLFIIVSCDDEQRLADEDIRMRNFACFYDSSMEECK